MDGKILVEAIAPSPEKMEFYTWAFPGSPVRVRFKIDLVPSINEYLMQGLEADPKQPREAGGILLGGIQGNCVEITGFDPFVCTQHQGPIFVVKDQDRTMLQKTIDRWNQPDSPSQAVGYFRSQTPDPLCLHDDDVALIDAAFPNPFHVFLLVKTAGADGWPVAGFFFRDGGKVFTESLLPFPFDQDLLETEARAALLRVVETADEVPPDPPQAVPSGGRGFKTLALAAFILSLAALALTVFSPNQASPVSAGKPLTLQARQNQDGLVIVWDPALPAIRNARIGMLSFHDGNGARQEEVPLSPAVLQTGLFLNKTNGKAARITLEVFSPEGRRTSEMAIVSSTDQDARIADATVGRINGVPPPGVPPSLDSARDSSRAMNTEIKPPEEELPSRNPPRQFKMPERERQEPVPASIFAMDPPAIEQRQQTPAVPPTAAVVTAAALPPVAAALPPPDSRQTQPAEEPEVNPAPPVKPPAVAAAATSAPAIPPKPVQQIRPELPANLRNMLQNEVLVQVHVLIDAAGRVTRATPLHTRSTIAEYAGRAAATAALHWRFEPAQSNGQAVPSEIVLEFRFAPAAKR